MGTITRLTGSAEAIQIAKEEYRIRAVGLIGEIEDIDLSAEESGIGFLEDEFVEILKQQDFHTDKVFELTIESEQTLESAAVQLNNLEFYTQNQEPAFELTIPEMREGMNYAILHSAENGELQWFFPEPVGSIVQETGGGSSRGVFYLPRKAVRIEQDIVNEFGRFEGGLNRIGKRLFRILSWPVEELAGWGAKKIARRWEKKKRPYGFNAVSPVQIGGEVSWDVLQEGKALLLCHGFFVKAEDSFRHLIGTETFSRIHDAYQGRVFTFEHPTLHHSALKNCKWLVEKLTRIGQFNLDILSTSRSGLVARFFEREMRTEPAINVGKLVMISAPNHGNPIVDPDNISEFINRITNIFRFLPGGPIKSILQGLLIVVKIVARGAARKLPGIQCMHPNNNNLQQLNNGQLPVADLYGIGANFDPAAHDILSILKREIDSRLVDPIFSGENDTIAPTNGVFTTGTQKAGFPIRQNHVLHIPKGGTHHFNYFKNKKVLQWVDTWLTDPVGHA